jgi:hypothetical protein
MTLFLYRDGGLIGGSVVGILKRLDLEVDWRSMPGFRTWIGLTVRRAEIYDVSDSSSFR